jgi:molybdopterin molybdotransferase
MKTIKEIVSELQDYNPDALKATDVNIFLSALVEPVTNVDKVSLDDSLGRILAQDIISPISVPPHDNSAMDGYAFAGAQIVPNTTLTLQVVGIALAGKVWYGDIGLGQCVKIMTGAIMPLGADTVVPLELTSTSSSLESIQINIAPGVVRAFDNRRLKGEDLKIGGIALHTGEILSPAAQGLLASLGLKTVPVLRKIRVAYFSTGDEIQSLDESAREGAIYDSNRYTIHGLLRQLGCVIIDMGVVKDSTYLLEKAFSEAANKADVVITSGGVSAGDADFTKAMLDKLGDVVFWKIAMRPGRPMAVGRIGKALMFGLPGNPVAVMVVFLNFVRPALLKMMGASAVEIPLLKAHSTMALSKKIGRTEYQRCIVSTGIDGQLYVKTTGDQGSGMLRSMVQANGLIVLHHDQASVNVGDLVDILMFNGVMPC